MKWEHDLRDALRELARTVDEVPENRAAEQRLLEAFDARAAGGQQSSSRTGAGRTAVRWYLAAAASVAIVAGGWWLLSLRGPAERAPATVGAGGIAAARPAVEPSVGGTPGVEAANTVDAGAGLTHARTSPNVTERRRPTRSASRIAPAAPPTTATDEADEFVALPAADRLPGIESGMIVRVDIPVTSLPAYGYPIVPEWSPSMVSADVLVGQDGQPRAIRLVSMQTGPRRQR